MNYTPEQNAELFNRTRWQNVNDTVDLCYAYDEMFNNWTLAYQLKYISTSGKESALIDAAIDPNQLEPDQQAIRQSLIKAKADFADEYHENWLNAYEAMKTDEERTNALKAADQNAPAMAITTQMRFEVGIEFRILEAMLKELRKANNDITKVQNPQIQAAAEKVWEQFKDLSEGQWFAKLNHPDSRQHSTRESVEQWSNKEFAEWSDASGMLGPEQESIFMDENASENNEALKERRELLLKTTMEIRQAVRNKLADPMLAICIEVEKERKKAAEWLATRYYFNRENERFEQMGGVHLIEREEDFGLLMVQQEFRSQYKSFN